MEQEQLLPLSEYESDPKFSTLNEEDKSAFYNGYFKTREEQAKNEDDYNSILKEKADREVAGMKTEYGASFPKDTQMEPNKLGEGFTMRYNDAINKFEELEYNINRAEIVSHKTDGMTNAASALVYKPYKYKGKNGYSITYPNGDQESITGIENESQLTEFFKSVRQEKFKSPDGQIDYLPELNDKIRKVDAGLKGATNAFRKTYSGMLQGFYLGSAVSMDEKSAEYNEYQTKSEQLTKLKESLSGVNENDPKYKDALFQKKSLENDLRNLSINPIAPVNKEDRAQAISSLMDEMAASEKINGTRALDDFDRFVKSQPKDQQGGATTMPSYFLANPEAIVPYLAASAVSTLPDTIAGMGVSLVGGIAGGKSGAGIAGGAFGAYREYTATVLSEIQNRALDENKLLTDPGVIDSILADEQFMDGVKKKANIRAGVIGGADAVLGGAAEKIVDTIKGSVKRAVVGSVVGAGTEAIGEAGAQAATEDKINYNEVFSEGLGGLSTGAPLAAGGVIVDKIKSLREKKDDSVTGIKAEVDARAAATRESLNQRAEALIPKDINAPEAGKDTASPPVAPPVELDQNEKNYVDQKKTDNPSYDPSVDTTISQEKKEAAKKYLEGAEAAAPALPAPEGFTQPLVPGVDNSGETVTFNKDGSMTSSKKKGAADVSAPDAQLTEAPTPAPVEDDKLTPENFKEKSQSFVFKAIDKLYSIFGKNPNLTDEGARRNQAATILTDNFKRGMLGLISDKKSFDRIMSEIRDSGYDASSQGRLMDVMGITANDSDRRIITNVLGNFWSAGKQPDPNENTPAALQGMAVAEAMDLMYREAANVASYYEMNDTELSSIDKADMLINMAGDSMITDENGIVSPIQSYRYPDMSTEDSVARFNAVQKATQIRNPAYDPSLDDKYKESVTMARENIKVSKASDLGTTDTEIAERIVKDFPNGYYIKDAMGYGGKNVFNHVGLPTAADVANHIKGLRAEGKLNDIYVESAVFLTKKESANESKKRNEFRVHLYVDKNGKAHVFKNLTFNKRRSYYNQEDRQTAGIYENGNLVGPNPDYDPTDDTFLLIPDSQNNPEVAALQEYAQKLMSGKPEFRDMIFGLDTSMVQVKDLKDGKFSTEAFAFEANPTTFGMSGWLGNPIAMSEIISEMTGRPSVLAGLYEIAKLNLTKDQLTEISAKITEGMPSEYVAYPEYYDSVQKGVALFNKYVPVAKWMQGMKSLFNMPDKFFKHLWSNLTSVFAAKVDPAFNATQTGSRKAQGTEKKFPAYHRSANAANAATVSPVASPAADTADTTKALIPQKNATLGGYIKQLLQNPQLTESQRSVLLMLEKNSSPALQNKVKVRADNKGYSYYSTAKGTIGIQGGMSNLRTAIHEVVHAVTSDYLQANLTKFGWMDDVDTGNDQAVVLAYYKLSDPANRKMYMAKGVPGPYIDIVSAYTSALSSYGYTAESVAITGVPVGASAKAYNNQAADKNIPYGLINLDEFMSEAMTNKGFQEVLSQMPPVKGNSKSLLSYVWKTISKVLGIPFNKASLLADALSSTEAVIKDKSNDKLIADMFEYTYSDGTKVLKAEINAETQVREVNGVFHKEGEVSPDTASMASKAKMQVEKDAATTDALTQRNQSRFNSLKAQFPQLLKGVTYNGSNLSEIREIIIDYLEASLDDTDDAGEKVTEKKKQAAAQLTENKVLAAKAMKDLINDPAITDSQANHLMDAIEYIFDETSDPLNMTTNKIKYYSNVLDSLSDGGPPIGFKHIAPKVFSKYWMGEYARRGLTSEDFSKPIGNWRRNPFFSRSPKIGSTSTLASEVSYMGKTKKGQQFIQDMLGSYRDNIDQQQLEEAALKTEFYDFVKKKFPKGSMSPLSSSRIGVVARLTQYEKTRAADPLAQIVDRTNQLTESINGAMTNDTSVDPSDTKLAKLAISEILGTTDMSKMADANAAIAYLEGQLTQAERDVLNKVREMGARLLPSLKVVKAVTKKSVLQDWENYVHDSSRSPRETVEQDMLKVFNSMSDVLSDREGIKNTKATYAVLDIRAIAEHQIDSSTYEKHSGVERFLLNGLLKESGPMSQMLDKDKTGIYPVSDRIRALIGSYHNTMTTTQEPANAAWTFIDSLVGAIQGSLVVGFNAFLKNAVSSSVARINLASLGADAFKNSFLYDNADNKKKIDALIKANFPTQFNRTNQFDIMEGRKERFNLLGKLRRERDLKSGIMGALWTTGKNLPNEMLNFYSDKILKHVGNLSNGIPEKYNSFAIWTAAYIHYGMANGTIKDKNDFLANMPIDKRAANDASDFVTRSLGYAPDKASKGSFWNGSSNTKRAISKSFFAFRQQSTGLALEFQNNMVKASRLAASGNMREAADASYIAAGAMLNAMSFRAMSFYLGATMLQSGLDKFFSGGNEEEDNEKIAKAKQEAIKEANRKYSQNTELNGIRDALSETITAMVPVTTSANLVEKMMSLAADSYGAMVTSGDGLFDLNIELKKDIKEEARVVGDDITKLERVIREMEKLGQDPAAEYEKLIQLEVVKSQLTEKSKFRYFPNLPDKAWFDSFGAYGIAGEMAIKQMKIFMQDDLTDPEKAEMDAMLSKDFAYHDPMAGAGFALNTIKNTSDFIRNFYPSEWGVPDNQKVPTEVFWRSIAKTGQNPSVVLARARMSMAKEALIRKRQNDKRVKELEEQLLGPQ